MLDNITDTVGCENLGSHCRSERDLAERPPTTPPMTFTEFHELIGVAEKFALAERFGTS